MRSIRSLITIILFLSLISPQTSTAYWERDRLQSLDDVDFVSLAVDTEDEPHIAIEGDTDLKYAVKHNGVWSMETVDSNGPVGDYCSIITDSNNNAHISYRDGNGKLRYAYKEGDGWEIDSVDPTSIVTDSSIALDNSGNPLIAYTITDNTLKYAYKSGFTWAIEDIDTGDIVTADLDTGSSGYPHIIYDDTNNGIIKYVFWNGATWQYENVTDGSIFCDEPSIAIDSQNRPHIAYISDNRSLLYAFKDVSGWHYQTVYDVYYADAREPEIAIDNNDNPNVSFLQEDFYYHVDSFYARLESIGWEIYNINTNLVRCVSHDVNSINIPWIFSPWLTLMYCHTWIGPWAFDLISPPDTSTVYEPVTLDWEDTTSGYGSIEYDVWYATNPDFAPHTEINGLLESTYTFPDGVLTYGEVYYWKVRSWDGIYETWAPNWWDDPNNYWRFGLGVEVSIDDDTPTTPTGFALYPAIPNPNDGSATIGYALPRTCDVELILYDIKGRKVLTLAEGEYALGEYEIPVSGLSSGVYLYKLEADEFVDTKKMVVK
ncbi:MAG: T9SS type A sorting domain-containing protein [bacterium]|nr:T9SS type A sorting domain-containing protein [bacterium]